MGGLCIRVECLAYHFDVRLLTAFLLMNNSPLKCSQFSCLAVEVQYTMASNQYRHQHLHHVRVGFEIFRRQN
jgi:hypothetical protein